MTTCRAAIAAGYVEFRNLEGGNVMPKNPRLAFVATTSLIALLGAQSQALAQSPAESRQATASSVDD
jgi:hypothetical protein